MVEIDVTFKVTSILANEIASFIFPRKLFLKRKLTIRKHESTWQKKNIIDILCWNEGMDCLQYITEKTAYWSRKPNRYLDRVILPRILQKNLNHSLSFSSTPKKFPVKETQQWPIQWLVNFHWPDSWDQNSLTTLPQPNFPQ